MAGRSVATPPELPGLHYVRPLGAGGFSDVYLYEQELPKRHVAVKVLASDDLTDSSRAAFVAEANLMAQLSAHPYIVTIYHAAVAPDGRPYFVMEYCSGPSLAEQYKRSRFSVADALRTGVRLSSAVATAHAGGILHRDIKPANVLTNGYGWPALTDFGISSAVDIELPVNTTTREAMNASAGATATGSIGMSIPWSPPEMFDDNPQPDVRSDVFSLAATLYTLLAGHTPFEVPGKPNGTVDLIGRIERGTVTPMERTDIPRSLTAILAKGMSVQADDRFATAIDFARALQRVEMELSYAPTAIDVPNLTILDRPGGSAEDVGDKTRIRGVATVHAQPVAPIVPPPSAAPVAVAQGADPTVIRRMPTVEPGGAPPTPVPEHTVIRDRPQPETPVDEEPTPESQPRRLLPLIAGAVAVVLIGGGVAAAAIFGSGQPNPNASPTPKASSDIVVAGVPSPEPVSVTPMGDGSSVTFAWSNPEPQEGDTFIWRRTGGAADDQPKTATEPSVTVESLTPGDRVCIEIVTRRSTGKVSGDPLEMCTQ
ncbi:serine/threonine protein kinase [Okibacterium sp. HSC-33S16]|uniref:protein kinase domain-containing protein n=1 Tax=Okibacterium sp. HSC-33S16 TaxID=2910965 RepID=UPI00209E6643|nr:protein kinase [Okibacterium sp. HSC-33S16]MCP2029990.1 serine/threonine protein kinase [Okibacterium sp. HSC-33S16]